MVSIALRLINSLDVTRNLNSPFSKPHWKIQRLFILTTLDACLVFVAMYLAFVLRLDTIYLGPFTETMIKAGLIYVAVHLGVFFLLGMYRQVWRYANFSSGLLIAKSTLVATLASCAMVYLVNMERDPPRSIPLIFWILITGKIAFCRFLWRGLVTMKGAVDKEAVAGRCFIYGADSAGELLIRHIKSNPRFPYRVVGFIDDNPNKTRQVLHGKVILGTGSDLVALAAEHNVDTVLIALDVASGKMVRDIVAKCVKSGISPLILPDIVDSLDKDVFKPRKIDIADLLRRSPKSIDKSRILRSVRGKVVLVTGAGGSIGSEICRQIIALEPAKLILLEMAEYNLYRIDSELQTLKSADTQISLMMGSVTDERFVESVFRDYRPHIVFHAAAYKHVPLVESNSIQGIKNNVFGTCIVAKAAHTYGTQSFLLISSDKAVNPVGVMGQTKRVCELIIQSMHAAYGDRCQFCAVRFGNVLGSSGSVIPRFLEQIAIGGPVTVTHSKMTRYFMLVSEAVGLVLQSVTMTKGGEIFVLNMGDPVNIFEMAKQLIALSGRSLDDDIEIVFTGLREGEKMFEELMYDGFEEKTDHNDIFITRSRFFDPEDFWRKYTELVKACDEGNEQDVRLLLQDLCAMQTKNQKMATVKSGLSGHTSLEAAL